MVESNSDSDFDFGSDLGFDPESVGKSDSESVFDSDSNSDVVPESVTGSDLNYGRFRHIWDQVRHRVRFRVHGRLRTLTVCGRVRLRG